MHFCHVTTFYPPHSFGGDAIGLQRLCHALARRGHRSTILCDLEAYRALQEGPDPTGPPEPDGINVVRLRSPIGAVAPILSHQLGTPTAYRRKLRAHLDAPDVDIINYHNISLVGGPGVLALGHAPKLYMAHEHWLVCPSHVLWRHNREPCTGRECLRCVSHFRRPPQLWRYTGLLQRNLHHVDQFIAMSEFSRAKHAEFGFPAPMRVMPYLIPDAEIAARVERGTPQNASPHPRPYFLFVGRLETIKGVGSLLPAFAQYGDADLLIAGDGLERQALETSARGNPRVHFLGRVDQQRLAQLYEAAIALIVPSLGFETFGIILIESFLQSTPVIARRLGPFPELVEKAQGGELFENTEELLSAMRRLQSDPIRRRTLGANGFAAVRRYWSESTVVAQYLDIANDAMERHREES